MKLTACPRCGVWGDPHRCTPLGNGTWRIELTTTSTSDMRAPWERDADVAKLDQLRERWKGDADR